MRPARMFLRPQVSALLAAGSLPWRRAVTFSNVPTLPPPTASLVAYASRRSVSTSSVVHAGTCYKCGQPGHFANECPNRVAVRQNVSVPESPVVVDFDYGEPPLDLCPPAQQAATKVVAPAQQAEAKTDTVPRLELNAVAQFNMDGTIREISEEELRQRALQVKKLAAFVQGVDGKVGRHYRHGDEWLPSVTTILSRTGNKYALEAWKKAQIAEKGLARFNAESKETMAFGSAIHNRIEKYLISTTQRGAAEPVEAIPDQPLDRVDGYWNSALECLNDLEDVKFVETTVCHAGLKYAGTVDAVVSTQGHEYVVVDWKTSAKKKATIRDLYDYPMQLCSYAGAINSDQVDYKDVKVSAILVCVVYPDGSPADQHFVDLGTSTAHDMWQAWLERLGAYYSLPPSSD